MPILGFNGQYKFLSNFEPAVVTHEGQQYTTVEHAYQAAKTLSWDERHKVFLAPTAAAAKKLGRQITMRDDWDDIKLSVMTDLCRQKFSIPKYSQLLLATGDEYIEETNFWNDCFWGVCRGVGENHLGKILMMIRSEIRQNSVAIP